MDKFKKVLVVLGAILLVVGFIWFLWKLDWTYIETGPDTTVNVTSPQPTTTYPHTSTVQVSSQKPTKSSSGGGWGNILRTSSSSGRASPSRSSSSSGWSSPSFSSFGGFSSGSSGSSSSGGWSSGGGSSSSSSGGWD